MDDVTSTGSVRADGAKALARYLNEEISTGRLGDGVKLPGERELSERFGASRGAVRRVLGDLKERGLITQNVGSGTFVRPGVASSIARKAAESLQFQTSPAELMEARLLIEPLMPRLIARYGTAADFAHMAECIERSEAANTVEEFEHWDGELHRTLAVATHNTFFMKILELANHVREQGEWGRLKRQSLTAERRAIYEKQHRALVDALRDRDISLAQDLLSEHLRQIQENLFGR